MAHQPGKTSFDHPASWLDREALTIGVASDNLEIPAAILRTPARQWPARVRPISPNFHQSRDEWLQSREHPFRPDLVMAAGRRHPDGERQAQRINQEMSFASFGTHVTIKATATCRLLDGLDALRIDDRDARLRVPLIALAGNRP